MWQSFLYTCSVISICKHSYYAHFQLIDSHRSHIHIKETEIKMNIKSHWIPILKAVSYITCDIDSTVRCELETE